MVGLLCRLLHGLRNTVQRLHGTFGLGIIGATLNGAVV
jgi:hypothetical protein